MLSAEVAAQLRTAIAERWSRPQQSGGSLAEALAVAAEEARSRSLRPEELLIALKTIEEDVAIASRVADSEERDRFRLWLVGACMRAFFSEHPKQDG
jgi:3-methyladenine DNA glycosylase Mpg